ALVGAGDGAGGDGGSASAHRPGPGQPVEVAVGSGTAPETSTFDEAVSLGLVAEISSYTTEFTSGAGPRTATTTFASYPTC
uniref:hypothetical protein n=1 Tax=Gordonibacter urolithinfaciens TaxID=1335613 RepID=UPI003A91A182